MENSPPPLPIERLHSIGVVCADIEPTLEQFSRFFGFEEWRLHRLTSDDGLELSSGAAGERAELLLATGGSPTLRFDVISPVQGNSILRKYVERHGAGLHDLTTHVMSGEEFDRALSGLRRHGVSILETVRIGDLLDIHYLNTKQQIATVVKVLVPRSADGNPFEHLPVEKVLRFEQPPANKHLPIDAPYHVCINTRSRRLSVQEAFSRIFGIDRWFEYDNETGISVEKDHYRGHPGDARFRLSCGRRGAFSVEVVEMLYGDSVYEDMLERRGEGIHHLLTTVCTMEDLETARASLEPEGYSIIQDGHVGSIYYGYLAADGKMADLAVEMLCPLSGNWMEGADPDFWPILMGDNFSHHPLAKDPPAVRSPWGPFL